LLLGGDDTDLETPRCAIRLEGVERRAASGVGRRDIGAQTAREVASGAILGQMDARCCALNRPTGFIRDLDYQRPGGAGAGLVDCTLAFKNLNM
jgi:hypothetical protein